MFPASTANVLCAAMILSSCLLAGGCSYDVGGPGAAQSRPTLWIGDPAPPLNIGQWVNGQPASSGFEGGVHVVEFWATWCGPCLASMPHISSLQEKYGDKLTVIGVTDEDSATVEAFLASESADGRPWSEVITYHLATDNAQATNRSYMSAANQSGIPTAFLIGNDGKIQWIGHPMEIDGPLRSVIEGS